MRALSSGMPCGIQPDANHVAAVSLRLSLGSVRELEDNAQFRRKKKQNAAAVLRQRHRRGRKEWESKTEKNRNAWRCSGYISSMVQALELAQGEPLVALEPWAGKLESKDQAKLLKELKDWPVALKVFSWLEKQDKYRPDVFLYNILLRTLGKAKQFDQVKRLWNQMYRESVAPTNVTYSTLLDVYGRAGLKDEALFFYNHMRNQGLQPDEVMVSTFINFQRRFGDVEAAEQAFRGLLDGAERTPRNPETYNTMLALYSGLGKYSEAAEVFARMKKAGVEPTTITFNTMISTYGKAGRLEDAESLVAKMVECDCKPDVATYNSLVEAYVRNGKMDRAAGCLKRMEEAAVCPDQVTYRTLIKAYADLGWAVKAEEAMRMMEKSGFCRDETANLTMIMMYVKVGQVSRSIAAFRHLHSGAGLEPSTYIAVLDAYAEARLIKEAEEVFALTQKAGLKVASIYNVMIKAYGLSSQSFKGLEVFHRMEAAGVKPNNATFNTVIQLVCKHRLREDLERVLAQMKAASFTPSLECYSSVISFYASLGTAKQAERTFNEMQKAGVEPDKVCYSALLNAYAVVGYAREAQETLRSMKAAGFSPDSVVYTSLIKLYSNLGLVEEARKVYMEIMRLKSDIFASNTMLDVYIKAGMLKEAEDLFRSMEQGTVGLNSVTCTMMLNLYNDCDKTEQAVAVAKLMQKGGLAIDIASLNSVIATYVKAGLMREALDVLKEMKRQGIVPDSKTFRCFDHVLEQANMPVDCIPVQLLEQASELEMLVILASLYAHADMKEEAVQIAELIQKAETETSMEVTAYNIMIFAFGKAGKLEAAVKVYMRMQTLGVEMNEATYASMITAYGRSGLLQGVARMFQRLKRAGYQPSLSTYKTVIRVYKDAGRMDLANMVAQEMHFAQFIKGGMRQLLEKAEDGEGSSSSEQQDEEAEDDVSQ